MDIINVYGFRINKDEIQCYYKFSQDFSKSFDGSIDVKNHPSEDFVIVQFKNAALMKVDAELLQGHSTNEFMDELDRQLGLV